MSIFEQIKGIGNKILSKIYGQKMRVGIVVAGEKEVLPSVLPEVTVTPRTIYQKAKADYTPYLVIGGIVIAVILITR